MSKERDQLMKCVLTVEIELIGPLLTRSVEARHFSEDQSGLVVDGRPALPGTLVKGVFRSALEELAEELAQNASFEDEPETLNELDEFIEAGFGPAVRAGTGVDGIEYGGASTVSENQESWVPVRGSINFAGYWLAEKCDFQPTNLTRIEINERLGTVEPGSMLVACSPIAPGQHAVFGGTIECWCSPERIAAARTWLTRAACLIDALGGATTVGFGSVNGISISEPEILRCTVPDSSQRASEENRGQNQTSGFGLRIKPDRPFCFSRPHGRSNVLVSEPFIPGGAIIGAVANALQSPSTKGFDDLEKNLHAIHVSHAYSVADKSSESSNKTRPEMRPIPLPLSLACAGETIIDFASETPELAEAPVFAPDWKSLHRKKICGALGIEEETGPERVSIVRNRIDPTTGSAADAALFALDAIDPSGHEWLSNLTLDNDALIDGADPWQVLAQFRAVLELGLAGLGKTKARAQVEMNEKPWLRQFERTVDDDMGGEIKPGSTVRLLLASGADLMGAVGALPGTGKADRLQSLYQDYFDRVFGKNSLALCDWFTREYLAGGRYVYKRFWSSKDSSYQPHVMTAAGSLFVLKVNSSLNDDAIEGLKATLARVRKLGLPAGPRLRESADSAASTAETAWQRHPWLSSQGYGEVIINPEFRLSNEKGEA